MYNQHHHIVWILSLMILALISACSSVTDPAPPAPPSTIQISIQNASMTEGDTGSGLLDFAVTLSAEPDEGSDVAMAWTTQDGTALVTDGDYTSSSGTLTFTHGQPLVQQVSITVHGDTKLEPDETFTVVLSNPTHAELGTSTAVGTVLNDDDQAPVGEILRVDPSSSPAKSGQTWAAAYHSIQEAVDALAAAGGGEVWVAAGTYTSGSTDAEVPVINLKTDVHIYGGFEGYAAGAGAMETERSQRDYLTNITILDGQDSSLHVLNNQNINGTVVDGFTITGGHAEDDYGGGLNLSYGEVILANCIFSGNHAGWGGGIYANTATLSISDCIFGNGTAKYGAGINCYRSSPLIQNCRFENNSVTNSGAALYLGDDQNPDSVPQLLNCTLIGNHADSTYGGGIYVQYASPVLTNCSFEQNTANTGAGVFMRDSFPTLTDCTFVSNNAQVEGGGIFCYTAEPELTNCDFITNEAGRGGGMYNVHSAQPVLTNCLFDGNQASGTYGGGIANSNNSSSLLMECTITGNTAVSNGGGVFNYSGTSSFTDCFFGENSAGVNGGGMFSDYTIISINRCRFSHNSAVRGGGIYNDRYSSSPITNTIFDANSAADDGGAICNNDHSSVLMANCTLTLNTAADDGAALYNMDFSSPKLINCILYGNIADCVWGEVTNEQSATAYFSCCNIFGCSGMGEGWVAAYGVNDGGNIDELPMFANAGGGNFTLQAGSPCIDAGNNIDIYDIDDDTDIVEVLPLLVDFSGSSRYVDDPATADTGVGSAPISDIGAHEFQ